MPNLPLFARMVAGLAVWAALCGPAAAQRVATVPLAPAERADLDRIATYLDGVRTLAARFVQSGTEGGVRQGTFLLQRPGRMRFEYDRPSRVLLLSTGDHLVYHDALTLESTFLPLSSTPLVFLAKPKVAFDGEVAVTRFQRVADELAVSLRMTADPDSGELTLIFAASPLALRGWTVLDAQHVATKIALSDIVFGGTFDQRLFEFRDPRLGQDR